VRRERKGREMEGLMHALLFHHLGMFGTRLIAFALSPLNRKRPRPAEL